MRLLGGLGLDDGILNEISTRASLTKPKIVLLPNATRTFQVVCDRVKNLAQRKDAAVDRHRHLTLQLEELTCEMEAAKKAASAVEQDFEEAQQELVALRESSAIPIEAEEPDHVARARANVHEMQRVLANPDLLDQKYKEYLLTVESSEAISPAEWMVKCLRPLVALVTDNLKGDAEVAPDVGGRAASPTPSTATAMSQDTRSGHVRDPERQRSPRRPGRKSDVAKTDLKASAAARVPAKDKAIKDKE